MHDPDAGIARGLAASSHRRHTSAKKPRPGADDFIQHLIPAIPVNANCRSHHEGFRRLRSPASARASARVESTRLVASSRL